MRFKVSPTDRTLPYFVGLEFREWATASRLWRFDRSMPNTELREVIEEPKYLQKPQYDGDNDNAIQDALDLTLHGDEAVHQPQQQTDYAKCDDNGD
jgi:hypothetical protein